MTASLLHGLPPFTHAFQPIVDTGSAVVYAHEALIRGIDGAGAASILSGLDDAQYDRVDRASRASALTLAARLGMPGHLSLNAIPRSFQGDEPGSALRVGSADAGFPLSRVIVEVTENEAIHDLPRFLETVAGYRRLGVRIAIDDFGAGHSGLNLLADFQPDLLKLDMNLVRNIESRGARQAIVRAILQVCEDLAIDVIAEGVETHAEYLWFADHGVRLFQGYLFARPGFESMPFVHYPAATASVCR